MGKSVALGWLALVLGACANGGESRLVARSADASFGMGDASLVVRDATARVDAVGALDASRAADAGVDAGPVTVNVSGRVRYYVYGEPVAGAVVSIGAASVVTDEDGTFVIDDVESPYDVVVKYLSGGSQLVHVTEGLTRPDPSIELYSYDPRPAFNSTITGTVSGGSLFPLPAGHAIRVITAGPFGGTATSIISEGAASGAFTLYPGWRGESVRDVNVYALEYVLDSNGLPAAYVGFGATSVTVRPDAITTNANVSLSPVLERTATTTLSGAAALENISMGVGFVFEPGCATDVSGSGRFPIFLTSFATSLAQTTGWMSAQYPGGLGSLYQVAPALPTRAAVAFETRAALRPSLTSGSSIRAGDEVSWEGASGVSTVVVRGTGNLPVYLVTTAAHSITWPALAPGAYKLTVSNRYELTSTDELCAEDAVSALLSRVTSPSLDITVE